ncbi:MAG: 30S ribosomal protein S5 [Thiotrichales bacterium]|nr:MAG: 30S ribosomal protein S5 [Thiotrichales bacterium]
MAIVENALTEKCIKINRTAKVVKGGRRFSLSGHVVVGDENGKVGFGSGKGKDVASALKQAITSAKLSMKEVALNEGTLPYPVSYKFNATKIIMFPAAPGTGIIAGGAMRAVFEVVGVKNVMAKVHGSTNPINVAKATLYALYSMKSPSYIKNKLKAA